MGYHTRAAILLVLLTLGWGAPAMAAFTEAEKAQEVHYRKAATYITGAMHTYMAYTFNLYVQPTNKAALTAAALTTIRALDEINDGYSALVGDISADTMGTPRFVQLETSRAARLQVALDKAARLKAGPVGLLPQAIAEWNAAKRLVPYPGATTPDKMAANVAYVDGVSRVADRYLTEALKSITAFDVTLPYLNPKPPVSDPVKFGSKTIVGPHGDFRQAQWEDWRGRVYTIRAAMHLATAVQLGPMPQFTHTNSGRVFTGIGLIVEQSLNGTASTSAMPGFNPEPFSSTLDVLRIQSSKYSGIPGAQHFWFFDVRDWYGSNMGRLAAYDRHVLEALVIFADGWSHINEGSWQRNVFPGCPPVCAAGR